ncbi:uncharacterized protein TRIADDRAFT_52602 [Trichoplax adhaerens]|uniref:Uncharacterized protein n=1 Tax=Trichoplax adhaerens TaxID=10228 RepID=B3RJF2_TRIAD|nr:hypothetical protein TRIADDRAFT_52602 [Trichoplax adhaerens]EDV29813.1 hypothetical protein TRIADDRAFT_52602 [Trichoplax adhaerens]|eukprot:XP_002109015.1 hypothetical protein TRIADDRAFT_52602 [Trichoplax adhaerens]
MDVFAQQNKDTGENSQTESEDVQDCNRQLCASRVLACQLMHLCLFDQQIIMNTTVIDTPLPTAATAVGSQNKNLTDCIDCLNHLAFPCCGCLSICQFISQSVANRKEVNHTIVSLEKPVEGLFNAFTSLGKGPKDTTISVIKTSSGKHFDHDKV